MKKGLKKLLCTALSMAMIAGSIVLPNAASAEGIEWSADAGAWKFDFGSTENVADGYIGVSADTKYDATKGYGFLGLENGYSLSGFEDGFTMIQGYDLTLENGGAQSPVTADDDYVATTVSDELGVNPIRFAMKSEPGQYYKVKVNIKRADVSKEANVTLYTERRHQNLLNEPVPEDGLSYECSVFVHNWWDKNGGEKVDNMLNVVALGENVAVSSIEVTKTEQGKTLFVLTDSTGCEQTSAIPYFPLEHCQGVGSAMAKYLGSDWALVNEGQSGLSSSASKNHYNNCKEDIQPGDVVWFQFGHNDDKVSGDPASNGYLSTLEEYYNDATSRGANFVVVGPIDRNQTSQYNNETGKWSSTLSHYSAAGKKFVEDKIAAGAQNIVFVDLNAPTIEFLNEISAEINPTYNYGAASTRFYYFVSKEAKYQQDYTHPNDYGADNFAKMFVDGANEIIETDADSVQAKVLASLLEGQRTVEAVRVPESIYSLGTAPNSAYTSPLVEVVYYDYPWLLSKVTFDEEGYFDTLVGKLVACKEISSVYARGIVEIYDKNGDLKGKVTTKDTDEAFFDSSITGDQVLRFAKGADTVKYDEAAGDTYKVYATDIDQVTSEDSDIIVSNTLTEKDNYDVKNYLIQGASGTENKEDFTSYTTIATGETLIGTNGWSSAGSVNMLLSEEGGKKFASVSKGDSASSHYVYKNLSQPVSTGQVLAQFDVRYREGVINFEFTDGSKAPNSFPPLILPIEVKTVDSKAGVYLDKELVSEINTGEWINIQYIIDLDYGTHTAKVNGKELTKDIPQMQGDGENVPSKLAAIAFVETTKAALVDYDITNIVVAELNAPPLPDYTLKAKSSDKAMGTVNTYVENEESSEKVSAFSETDGISLEYENGNAIIKSTIAQKVVLLEAKYSTEGTLENLKSTLVELDGTKDSSIPVSDDCELMLWDSLDGMIPLDDTVTAFSGSVTVAKMNTYVTAEALPNDGYIFIGWIDENGVTVSTDKVYTFKLRKDTTLTAQFAKAGGVEDVADFEINTDKAKMAIGTEQTVNLSVSNVVDANGNDVQYDANTDVVWSCDDDQITVNGGILTIPEDYVGESFKNIVPVKCTINNISKNINLVLYSTDYYEDFSAITDFSEWISNTGTTSSLFEVLNSSSENNTDFSGMKAVGNGNVMVIGSGENGDEKTLAYDRDLGLSNYTTLKFGFDIEPYQIRTDNKDASVTLQFVDSDGTKVFDILVNTAGKNSSFNGTEVAGFTKGTVVSVDTEFDFSAKTMKYTLTNSAGIVLATGTAGVTANNLAKMSFSGTWQYGKFAIDNVYADYE